MAKLLKGLYGPISGKVGNMVFVTRNNTIVLLLVLFGASSHPAYAQVRKPQPLSTQKLVQQIYTSQIGIREIGTNSGPMVGQYLRYVNLPKGNPWCAAFVCWVFGEANIVNPRTGWSSAMFPASRTIWTKVESGKQQKVESGKHQKVESGKLKVESGWAESRCAFPPLAGAGGGLSNQKPPIPSTGDIFGLYFPERKRIAHVGFIDQWDGTWMVTVEGNTNVSGSREGDGVYRKRRLVRTVYKVARFI